MSNRKLLTYAFLIGCSILLAACSDQSKEASRQPEPTEQPASAAEPKTDAEPINLSELDFTKAAVTEELSDREPHKLQRSKQIELEPAKSAYRQGEEIGYTLANASDYSVRFGDYFTLEALVDGKWHRMDLGAMVINDIGYHVGRGGEMEAVVPLGERKLPAGVYRIVKGVSTDNDLKQDEVVLISGEFQVE